MAKSSTIAKPDRGLLDEVVRRILGVNRPLAIILFGSQARGEAHRGSDMDLLIVDRIGALRGQHRATPYRMALLGIDCDIDIVVYTPEEIADWAAVPNAFVTTALREGRILYENSGGPGARLVG